MIIKETSRERHDCQHFFPNLIQPLQNSRTLDRSNISLQTPSIPLGASVEAAVVSPIAGSEASCSHQISTSKIQESKQ